MKLRIRYANVVSTLALILALSGTAYAAVVLEPNSVGTVQLKAGAVRSTDLAANAVRTTDIQKGAVRSSDVATNGVTVGDLSLPAPDTAVDPTGGASFAPADGGYVLVDDLGTFDKAAAASAIEVDWSGAIGSRFVPAAGTAIPCVFQIRVDGAPDAIGASEVYVGSGETTSAATSAIYDALPVGSHTVQIWARSLGMGSSPTPANCVVTPGDAGVDQTATVTELAV